MWINSCVYYEEEYDVGMETKTKEQLKREIEDIERVERLEADRVRREKNYELFKNRPEDWVIGRAHCEPAFRDNGWHHPKGPQMPISVSIRGNMGHTYYPTAWITDATNTYFHNVWKDKDRKRFEKALEKLVQKEVEKIAKQLTQTLEILGLQSDEYHIREKYPENKVSQIRKEIWEETKKVLDGFSDKEFKELLKKGSWVDIETGERCTNVRMDISHGCSILKKYLSENRPKLVPLFKEIF